MAVCAKIVFLTVIPWQVVSSSGRSDCLGLPLTSQSRRDCLERLISSWEAIPSQLTTSSNVLRELVSLYHLEGSSQKVLELGCGAGRTTSLLAELFASVYVMDKNVTKCKDKVKRYNNVHWLQMDLSTTFGWDTFSAANEVSVAFIDAAHLYKNVVMDTLNVLALPSMKTLIYHDAYVPEIRRAISDFEKRQELVCNCKWPVAELPAIYREAETGYSASHGGSEACLCERGSSLPDGLKIRHERAVLDDVGWVIWYGRTGVLGAGGRSWIVSPGMGNMQLASESGIHWKVFLEEGQMLYGEVINEAYTAMRVYDDQYKAWGFGMTATEVMNSAARYFEEYQEARYWRR